MFVKRSLRLLGALLATGLLTSCLRIHAIQPTGSIQDGIVFRFHDTDGARELKRLNVVEFVVEAQVADGQWSPVWRLEGSEKLTSITYGAEDLKFRILVPAVPLRKEGVYRARLKALAVFGTGGRAGVVFEVSADGVPVVRRFPQS